MRDLIVEMVRYFRIRRRLWLLPVFAAAALLALLLAGVQGSAAAPLIYTLF